MGVEVTATWGNGLGSIAKMLGGLIPRDYLAEGIYNSETTFVASDAYSRTGTVVLLSVALVNNDGAARDVDGSIIRLYDSGAGYQLVASSDSIESDSWPDTEIRRVNSTITFSR